MAVYVYSAEDITRLRAAIISGVQRSRVGNEEVQFRSQAEMLALLEDMIATTVVLPVEITQYRPNIDKEL